MYQQAQYSRRNYLFFYGIKEEKGEDTDSIVINTVKEEMEIVKQRRKKDQY